MELNFLSRINAQQVRRFGKGNSGRNKRISICTVPLSFSLSLSFFIEHKRIVDDGIFPNERKEGEDW